MSTTAAPRTRRRMPITVIILAGLMALKAMLLLTASLPFTISGVRSVLGMSHSPELAQVLRDSPLAVGALLLTGMLLLVSAVGMLSRRRTGWLLAMVLTGLFVAIDIYGFLNGDANHFWMALNIVTVFYLNQPDLRAELGVTSSIAGTGERTKPA